MSPLNLAIEHFDERAVASLLASGADANRPEPELGGCSPLQHAVDIECEESCRRYDMGDPEAKPRATITRLLVHAGALPDLADPKGRSARSDAEERLHLEALHLFDSTP
jgi:hypothetical protein